MSPAPPAPAAAPAAPAPTQSGNFVWQNDGDKVEINYRGTIEFSDDDTDVVKLSPGGRLRVSDGGWFRGQSAEFTADANGQITRRYWVGSTERPYEPEGRQWVAKVLPRFIRQSGLGAPARVARIFKAKGAPGVLSEISLIQGSWGKRVYFSELLKMPGIDARTVQQILSQAGREMDSDYELASLLIATSSLLADEGTRRAYLEAARSIESDYEMRRVFASVLKQGNAAQALVPGILDAATNIDSDYELASLLIQVAGERPIDNTTRAAFFKALASVSSSYEHRRALSAVVKPNMTREMAASVLTSVAEIESDFERASLLLEFLKESNIEGELRAPFFHAVNGINSSYERGRVLQTLVKRGDASEATVLEVIKSAKAMDGSYESSQVMLAVAGTYPALVKTEKRR